MTKALNGIKVLDVSRLLTGPYCTMVLADLGADVIKVEVPGRGDDSRLFGPFANGESAYFAMLNRNKRSITLDLRKEEGKAVFRTLVADADVMLENFALGTMDEWGLGYEALSKLNPKLVYASITGFGQTGPYSTRTAFDAVAQAMGGMMSLTGYPDSPPLRVGASLGDINAGVFTVTGILAALVQRGRTGKGQRLDISMHDCIFAILENALVRYTVGGQSPGRMGSRHASVAPYDVFPTSDGFVIIACANEATWQRLCKSMGRDDLILVEKFKLNAVRSENVGELSEIISGWSRTLSTADILEVLEKNGVPGAPILGIEQLAKDPQLKARNMLVEMDHPTMGKFIIPGNPVKLSDSLDMLERPAPLLGQDTDEVLRQANYTEDQIKQLREAKII